MGQGRVLWGWQLAAREGIPGVMLTGCIVPKSVPVHAPTGCVGLFSGCSRAPGMTGSCHGLHAQEAVAELFEREWPPCGMK